VRNGNRSNVEVAMKKFSEDAKQKWLDTPNCALSGLGRTALHLATIQCDSGTVEKLIEHGARFDIKDKSDMTPVDIAKEENYEEIIEIFAKAEKIKPLEEKIEEILNKGPKIANEHTILDN